MRSEITIYQDGEWLASFRVLNTEQDFNNIKTVTCEGELAYLLDSNQRIAEYHDISVADYFSALVEKHNADVDEFKRFTVGAVTITDPNDSLYRYSNYEATWDAIQDKLVSRLGGCIRCRRVNGVRTLDYVTDYGNVNLQVIRFGENILDLVQEAHGEDIVTVLIPLGAMNEETEMRLTVASVNEGKDYIENAEAIASNHADVMHWFPKHGKNMDTFRADVKAALEADAKKQTTPELDNIPAAWAKEAVEWATSNKLMAGDDKGNLMLRSSITREQFCVILKRYHDTFGK